VNSGMHVLRMRWGKVVSIHAYLDTQVLIDTFNRMAASGPSLGRYSGFRHCRSAVFGRDTRIYLFVIKALENLWNWDAWVGLAATRVVGNVRATGY
jgi:hypothetical protein